MRNDDRADLVRIPLKRPTKIIADGRNRRQATLPLLPMPRGAYKDVIEGPVRRFTDAGGAPTIEPQLSERLLEDIGEGGGSDALPLLAFTLEQLFLDYRRAGALRFQKYEDFGGLEGAIDAWMAMTPRVPLSLPTG
jgi:hypothetical protein